MGFTKEDIKIVETAIKHYDNKERGLAIRQMRKIPFFKAEINWFASWIIQDMDKQDKGINENRAREYLAQALNWVKTHQKDDLNEEQ